MKNSPAVQERIRNNLRLVTTLWGKGDSDREFRIRATLRSCGRGCDRTFTNQEDANYEHHYDSDIQAHVHEVLIKLRIGHGGKMREFGARGENAPRTGYDADSQIGFEIKYFRLEKPDHGSEQLKQDDDKQEVVQ